MNDKFVRPGIDDRPDYGKALTAEQKEAVSRLAEHPQNTKTIESIDGTSSATRQAARMDETNYSAAIAGRGEVPDPESAMMDMRDPMVASDGSRPSAADMIRLGIGFTLSTIVTGVVWVSLSSILLPQLVDQIAPDQRAAFIGLINSVGSVVALFSNIIFGTFSDLTRSRFGKRTLWICSGGVLCGLCAFGISFTRSLPVILLLWCGMQVFYNWMNAPFCASLSDRVPDKFRGTLSSFMGGGGVLGQTAGSLVGSLLITKINLGFAIGALGFAAIGFIVVAIWPAPKSNLDEPRAEMSVKNILKAFIPPVGAGARNFYFALIGRMMMVAGYQMITGYQLYIIKYYTLSDSGLDADGLKIKAAGIVATMSVITMVASLLAAFTAGPISDYIGMRKIPVSLAAVLFAIGAAMPWIFHNAMGMYLFAAIAGFGYGVYNAIDQALNLSILPNPAEAGKDLGILNMANTLSSVIGAALASGLVMATNNYMLIFPACIVVVLLGSVLILCIRGVK